MSEPDKNFHLLVLSDIHAHDSNIEASDAPSSYSTKANYLNNPRLNPLASIPGVLKDAGLKPDVIVTPGDLADKNDSSAQQVAWRQLEEIKKKTGAKRLIGTVGNHDIDSRRSFPDQLPNCSLKALSPLFPMAGNANADKFWSNGFVVYKLADFDASLAIINSCQLHGVIAGEKAEDEYRRGKIPSEVLENFRVAAEAVKTSKNVLLLHHHVRRHPNASDDRSHLENGETLIGILEHMGGPWLVVHGHLHLPWLSYGGTALKSPAILSAGSVAARTYPVNGQHPRNQMYFVSFRNDPSSAKGSGCKGTIRSWDWTPHIGWERSKATSGLPWRTGFGTKGGIPSLADAVDSALRMKAGSQAEWSELNTDVPALNFLTPTDTSDLVEALAGKGVRVHFDVLGVPEYVRKV